MKRRLKLAEDPIGPLAFRGSVAIYIREADQRPPSALPIAPLHILEHFTALVDCVDKLEAVYYGGGDDTVKFERVLTSVRTLARIAWHWYRQLRHTICTKAPLAWQWHGTYWIATLDTASSSHEKTPVSSVEENAWCLRTALFLVWACYVRLLGMSSIAQHSLLAQRALEFAYVQHTRARGELIVVSRRSIDRYSINTFWRSLVLLFASMHRQPYSYDMLDYTKTLLVRYAQLVAARPAAAQAIGYNHPVFCTRGAGERYSMPTAAAAAGGSDGSDSGGDFLSSNFLRESEFMVYHMVRRLNYMRHLERTHTALVFDTYEEEEETLEAQQRRFCSVLRALTNHPLLRQHIINRFRSRFFGAYELYSERELFRALYPDMHDNAQSVLSTFRPALYNQLAPYLTEPLDTFITNYEKTVVVAASARSTTTADDDEAEEKPGLDHHLWNNAIVLLTVVATELAFSLESIERPSQFIWFETVDLGDQLPPPPPVDRGPQLIRYMQRYIVFDKDGSVHMHTPHLAKAYLAWLDRCYETEILFEATFRRDPDTTATNHGSSAIIEAPRHHRR